MHALAARLRKRYPKFLSSDTKRDGANDRAIARA
jgi:hypothetical protein